MKWCEFSSKNQTDHLMDHLGLLPSEDDARRVAGSCVPGACEHVFPRL